MVVAAAPSIRLPLKSLSLTPGSCLTLEGLSWAEFEEVQVAYDERAGIRVAFCDGTLELKALTVVQERTNRLVAQIVKTLLDIENKDWEDFGRSTLMLEKKLSCVEPDTGFYVQNAERMRNCMRFDLDVDLPPDLAIACNLTSEKILEAYKHLQVPEIWIFDDSTLEIKLLEGSRYNNSQTSLIFPNIDICALTPRLLQEAFNFGSRHMLSELKSRFQSI